MWSGLQVQGTLWLLVTEYGESGAMAFSGPRFKVPETLHFLYFEIFTLEIQLLL